MKHTFEQETRPALPVLAPAPPGGSYGIYLHVPFCSHICPYCDFNTYAGQDERIPAYVAAVARETDQWAPRFAGRLAETVFLGGGTPSRLTGEQVTALLEALRARFAIAPDAEITIETNPNDISEAYCDALLRAGINRISIGAQSVDRRGLRVLGRRHEAAETATAVAAARSAGFTNVSLDFIYAWPGQTLDGWRRELDAVLSGGVGGAPPDHLSLYSLIVEPGTPMADAVARGIFVPADDDLAADCYDAARAMLADAGWRHYEISNWAIAPEFRSRHNALYWRNGEYVGLGAGAHGYVGGDRTMNQPSPSRYIAALSAGERAATNTDHIDARMAMGETMMLGLRLVGDGVSAEAFQRRHGESLHERFGAQIDRLRAIGMLEDHGDALRLTDRGILLANSVCAEFLDVD